MKYLSGIVLLLAAVSFAGAAPGVALTVYNDNLALVRDTRTMEFPRGAGEILFRDVAAQIDATSVHFRAPGVNLLEQNFDYDLVSPDKLLQKYVDQEIEIVTKNGEIVRGTLLTSGQGGFTGGQLVLREGGGALRSILLENAAEIRYPTLPAGLITRPTLRWLVQAEGGQKEAEVSYLTGGLSWRADYVLLLNEANTRAGLDAWVTLHNTSGAGYENAQLKLMAGEIHRAETPRPPYPEMMLRAQAADAVGAKQFEERGLFEYHLYTLQRPTTIADQQTKQISLFPGTSIGVRKIYEYDWQRNQERVSVSAEFQNSEENGLGMPLPAGLVRVYQESEGNAQEFIGEDRMEHTPKDEKVTVVIGNAFDIAVERLQTDHRRISDRVSESDFQVKLRNHKRERVEVLVTEHFWGDWEVTRSSHEAKKVSATKAEFRVTVEPDQEATLTYTVRTR